MKRLFFLSTLFICCIIANAQTTVKGVLLDSLTNEGEPYATIRISKSGQENKPVVMAVTDLQGNFSPELKGSGSYVISFSSVGRTAVKRTFTINGEREINLGRILISDDTHTLNAVEVVAQKPIVKMEADKMTYSVEDDIDAKSMTVLDMLRKVPMVTVDGQDNITVNGSGAFKVYVDGKPNPMFSSNASQIFKVMPASMVSSIEVITNPGAKFDAEGAGGVLDIKLAHSQSTATTGGGSLNGYNGSLSLNGGNKGGGVNAMVAGQQGRFTYNANAGFNYIDNGTVEINIDREQKDGSTSDYFQTAHNRLPVAMGNISMGYELDSLSSLNASFGLTSFNITNDGNPTVRMHGGIYGEGFEYSNYMKQQMGNKNFNGSADYQRFFSADHSSYITLTYQLNTNPGKNDTETTFNLPEGLTDVIDLTSRSSIGRTNTVEHVAQVDLVNKLTDHQTLNSGLKYSNRNSSSDMDYYLGGKYNEGMSTDYENNDQIGAMYAEIDNHYDKWSAKGGLRYEHTWQNVKFHQGNGEDFSKKYGNIVPSLSLSRTLFMGCNVGLTYNMRISRPGITYLNPYVDRSDPIALTYGNTALVVEKSNNIGLVFNMYTPMFMVNATLRETIANGGIEQYSFYKDNILNTTYGNIVNRRNTSFTLFMSLSLSKTTRFIFNGGCSYNILKSDILDRDNHGFQANAMMSVQQQLPKDWNVGVTAITNTKTYTLQGYNSGHNIGMLSVSKSLFKDKLNLSVVGITGLSKGGKLHINQYSEGKDFTNNMQISVPITRVMATATWKFGNTKKQFQKHQSRVQNDYIEHQSNTESIGNSGM